MTDAANWRIEQTALDYFGHQKKQMAVGDRRPVVRKASDLVGPGIAGSAVRVTDWGGPSGGPGTVGDLLPVYNGFFSSAIGANEAPNNTEAFVGYVVSDAELGGVQRLISLATGNRFRRVFNRNPYDPNTLYWGSWVSG